MVLLAARAATTTTVAGASKTVEAIGLGEKGTYMAALTFGSMQ